MQFDLTGFLILILVNVSLLSPPLPFFFQPAVVVFTGRLLFTRCASRG